MSTKNHADPWRYRCPECDSVSVWASSQNNQHGTTTETRYRCDYCNWRGDRVIDAKTGARI